MAAAGYRILDEPSPGALSRWVVHPFWPLLSLMLGGAWIAWPWFAFNSFALGSATLRRELLLIGVALVAPIVVVVALAAGQGAGLYGMGKGVIPYLHIAIYVVKLMCAYPVFMRQERGLGLLEYFGGGVRNGVLIVLGAMFLRSYVDELLSVHWVLRAVLQ